jgi:hypothetical protein
MKYYTKPRSAREPHILSEIWREEKEGPARLLLGAWIPGKDPKDFHRMRAGGVVVENPAFGKEFEAGFSHHFVKKVHLSTDARWFEGDDDHPTYIEAIGHVDHSYAGEEWHTVESVCLDVAVRRLAMRKDPHHELFTDSEAAAKVWIGAVKNREARDEGLRHFVWVPSDGGSDIADAGAYLKRQRRQIQRSEEMRARQFEDGTADYGALDAESFAKAFQRILKTDG